MKRKLLVLMMAGLMSLSAVACGGNSDTQEPDAQAEDGGNDAAEEADPEEPEDDGIIDFETEDFVVTYVRHEFGTDYEGNKCLLYYYNFTNNSDENTTAGMTANVQCFQDGSECEMAITSDRNESMDNYVMNEVQPGGTVEVCQAYKLKSDTELTIEASALISFDDAKDTQKIAVE